MIYQDFKDKNTQALWSATSNAAGVAFVLAEDCPLRLLQAKSALLVLVSLRGHSGTAERLYSNFQLTHRELWAFGHCVSVAAKVIW